MLTKIEVKGLFGTFDHSIELKKENVTLLLGENGLGKTIILKMVKSFFESNFDELQSNLFEYFILTFSDKSIISIHKIEKFDEKRISIGAQLIINFQEKNTADPITYIFDHDEENMRIPNYRRLEEDLYTRRMDNVLQNHLPIQIERVGTNKWIDHSIGKIYTASELLTKYRKYLPPEYKKYLDTPLPEWLVIKTTSLKIKFIETQRLLKRTKSGESAYHSYVTNYAQELIETIKNKTVAATDLASRLDRSYPNRVVKKITQTLRISDSELEEGLDKLNERRELLNRVGLLDTTEEDLLSISNAVNKQSGKNNELLKDVLQIYLEDSNEKLTIYDELAKKIDLLIKIINKRFLYKKMSIDKKKGFVFISSKTGNDIPLSGLSSGEQHELVLFFQLLFNTESESLLLIDEPEISLHVSWQNHFINDLTDVINLNNLSALIATHSPDIINNKWDLTIQLKGE